MNARGHYNQYNQFVSLGAQTFFGDLPKPAPWASTQPSEESSRGQYGRSSEVIKRDLQELDDTIRGFSSEIQAQVAVSPSRQSPLFVFWETKWKPFYNNWRYFYDETSKASLIFGAAKADAQLSSYRNKLSDMRADMRAALSQLAPVQPMPSAPPGYASSVVAPIPSPFAPADGKKDEPRYGLYAAIGVAAVAAVAMIAVVSSRAEAA